MFVYKLAKIFTICVSLQKVPVAKLESRQKRSLLSVNEYIFAASVTQQMVL
jgi:hypothetical protein